MRLNIAASLIVFSSAFASLQSSRTVLAADSTAPTLSELRLAGCKSLQQDFDRALKAHINDPAANLVMQRLSAMDEAAAAVLLDLRLRHDSFLSQSLATVGSADADDQDKPQPQGALKIFENYQAHFVGPTLPKDWPVSDRTVVAKYLQTASQTLATVIQSRAHNCLSVMGVDVAEIIRLWFVLPMLTIDQDQSLTSPPVTLPSWMARPSDRRVLQTFALEANRPRVAFALSRINVPTSAPADSIGAYITFVKQQADALLRTSNYKAAQDCLRDGITVAGSAKLDADLADLSFRIAEILETTASPKLAADEMMHVQATCVQASDYGRASMLRVKYLYEAGLYNIVVAEASTALKEPRCEAYLPQIMYLAWVSDRRQQSADADSWRKGFLDRFPDNPLAADLYFAAALDALSASNYDQASALLQFIEYRFPQFKMIEKVRQIHQRLAEAGQSHQALSASTAPVATANQ